MRRLGTLLLGLTGAFFLLAVADAGEEKKAGKEKTITGRITCAKCDFRTVKKADPEATRPVECQTIIIAKKGDKRIIYFFDEESHKKHHKKICTTPMQGSVTGTVRKDGEKRIISATEVKFKE
jgi:hypothetical protein